MGRYDDIADRVWPFIEDPSVQHSKEHIANLFNARYGTRISQQTMFGTQVRLRLERKAAARGQACISEAGLFFVTSQEDVALRRVVRRTRYHASHGRNLANPGSGVNVLHGASDPLSQDIADVADLAALSAKRMVKDLDAASALIKARDKAARQKAWKQYYQASKQS